MAMFGLGALTSKIGTGKAKTGFPRILTVSDFMSADVTTVAATYTKVGSYTIPAQQSINWGIGNATNPDNQGYVYIYLKLVAGTEIEGTVRLAVADANETRIAIVFEQEEIVLHGSVTDRRLKVPLPEITNYQNLGRSPREDDRLQIYVKTAAAKIVSYTASIMYLPVTIYQ